ncbi:MAG: hypothetical protein KDK54_22835, partial [Leptospiraceae bacterium]|nr:hypothetical protein [Leptospiraceae bacterium]
NLKRLANGTGRFFFASSAGNERSREVQFPEGKGQGLFTHVFLNALGQNRPAKYPNADLVNIDNAVSLNELNAYISENFKKQIKEYVKSEIQSPIPMTGMGRYSRRSRAEDFPFFELVKDKNKAKPGRKKSKK